MAELIEMTECVVWGDMMSDSAADQYPTVPVCAVCVKAYEEGDPEDTEGSIVSVGASLGMRPEEECYYVESH